MRIAAAKAARDRRAATGVKARIVVSEMDGWEARKLMVWSPMIGTRGQESVLIYVESFAPPALIKTREAHESRERCSIPRSEAVVVG